MVDEPEHRREVDAGLQDVYRDLGRRARWRCAIKAALKLIGFDVGAPRLPYVEPEPSELAVIEAMLERHGLLRGAAATR